MLIINLESNEKVIEWGVWWKKGRGRTTYLRSLFLFAMATVATLAESRAIPAGSRLGSAWFEEMAAGFTPKLGSWTRVLLKL